MTADNVIKIKDALVSNYMMNGNASQVYDELVETFSQTGRPIEVDFRKLVSWIKLGDQHTHFLHPYPAKLLPHIANFFLSAKGFHDGRSEVLDPFCGSGTVALEASLAGFSPNVADANPFALLLTKVKTTPFKTIELRQLVGSILLRASKVKDAPVINIIN